MKIYTLGTSHGSTEPGRACSGTLISVNDALYLFDCGGNVEGRMTDLNLPFGNLRCAFISHMHEDHAGTLTSIYKRFTVYNHTNSKIQMFLPEECGISAFKNWVSALHLPTSDSVIFNLTSPEEIYADENVRVCAISTAHIQNGKFPSYAYVFEAEGKRILYTGDLNSDFSDYPEAVLREKFDAVISELVHFNPEENLETIAKSQTDRIIFTHIWPEKADTVWSLRDTFPFPIHIAKDCDVFEV